MTYNSVVTFSFTPTSFIHSFIYSNLFPRVFHLPTRGSEGKKTLVQAAHVSLRQIYLHGRGPNLSEYRRRWCLISPKPALGNLGKLSFDLAANIYHIYSIAFNI